MKKWWQLSVEIFLLGHNGKWVFEINHPNKPMFTVTNTESGPHRKRNYKSRKNARRAAVAICKALHLNYIVWGEEKR
jgi:hypothetical protein